LIHVAESNGFKKGGKKASRKTMISAIKLQKNGYMESVSDDDQTFDFPGRVFAPTIDLNRGSLHGIKANKQKKKKKK
jgi:hypothetical protein